MVLIVAAVYLVGTYLQSAKTITVESGIYQYSAGQKIRYEGNCKLDFKDDTVTLRSGLYNGKLPDIPVYDLERSGTYAMGPLSIIRPTTNAFAYKIPCFSRFYRIEDKVLMTGMEEQGPFAEGFLYDGKDTYLFLEPVTITCREENISISPLSYVAVHYGQFMEIYDYDTDSCRKISLGAESKVTASTDAYSVDLNLDILIWNGNRELLFGKPAELPEYKG